MRSDQTRYTPGTWDVSYTKTMRGVNYHVVKIVGLGKGGSLVTVNLLKSKEVTYVGEKQSLPAREAIANAILMSAAPDLLESAKKALEECCDLIGTEAGNALYAAIEKATHVPGQEKTVR